MITRVSPVVGAVDELLLTELAARRLAWAACAGALAGHRAVVFDVERTLHRCDCGKGPATAAPFLVFHMGDNALRAPIPRSWYGAQGS